MAIDALRVFTDTYNQAVANGLPTAAAQLAAQSAMDNVLRQQALQVTPAAPIVSVPGSRLSDPGPSGLGRRPEPRDEK